MEELKDSFIIKAYKNPMYLMREIIWEGNEILESYEKGENFDHHLAEIAIYLNEYFKSLGMTPEEALKDYKSQIKW